MEAGPICKSNAIRSTCACVYWLLHEYVLLNVTWQSTSEVQSKNYAIKLFSRVNALLQAVIHGMLFAFVYLVLQKRQVLSEGKGEALFSVRISNLLLLLSIVSFIVRLFNHVVVDKQYAGLQQRLWRKWLHSHGRARS